MSIWNDVFEIYQSVQSSDDANQAESVDAPIIPVQKSNISDDKNDKDENTQPTVYVFAYIDDGKGNISRNIAVEDRITMLELKNQELEHRYNRLLEELEDSEGSNEPE